MASAHKSSRAGMLTRLDLARLIRVDPRTISRWQELGMPIARRGKGGRPSLYDERDVHGWLSRADVVTTAEPDFMKSRARKELAQARLAEQQYSLRAGRLLLIEDVEKTWSAEVAAVRGHLLNLITALPDRLSRIAATDGPAGVEAALHASIYKTLTELSVGTPAPKPHRTRRPPTRRRPVKKPTTGRTTHR